MIGAVVEAAYGDRDAARRVTATLTELDDNNDWAPLASALRRILDGDRAPALADGLNPVFAAAVTTILTYLPPDHPAGTMSPSPAGLARQIAATLERPHSHDHRWALWRS